MFILVAKEKKEEKQSKEAVTIKLLLMLPLHYFGPLAFCRAEGLALLNINIWLFVTLNETLFEGAK